MELPSSCLFGDLRWVLGRLVYRLKLFEKSSIQVHGVCLILKNLVLGFVYSMEKMSREAFSLLFLINCISTDSFPSFCPHLKKTFLPSVMLRACAFLSNKIISSLKKCTLHAIINDEGYITWFWTRWDNVQNTL